MATAPEPPPEALATVTVRNTTPLYWRVVFRDSAGNSETAIRVAPHATDEIRLRGGRFVVEQTVESAAADRPAPRTFAATFRAGERYRWALATLLTSGPGPRPEP